jgi:hypothetical protein
MNVELLPSDELKGLKDGEDVNVEIIAKTMN